MSFWGFVVIATLYGLVTGYFCWRFYLRRRPPSLVCAFMPFGWIVAAGVQLEKLPAGFDHILFGACLLVAVVAIYIIVHHELGREHPFC